MKNIKLILSTGVFLVLFLFTSCRASDTKDAELRDDGNRSNTITMIFDRHIRANDTFFANKDWFVLNTVAEVMYYDRCSFEEMDLKGHQNKDTFVYMPSAEYVVLRHRLDAFNYYEFLFKKGDSIVFSYDKGIPQPHLLNGTARPFDYNYDAACAHKFYTDYSTRGLQYFRPNLFLKYAPGAKPIHEQEKDIRSVEYPLLAGKLQSEMLFLDSIHTQSLISEPIYRFYKNRIQNIVQLLDMEEGKLTFQAASEIVKKDGLAMGDIPDLYYHQFLEQFTRRFIAIQAKKMDLKDSYNRDHRQLYDIISGSPLFTRKAKDYLLTKEMPLIANAFSKADFQQYFRKYKQEVKDTAMVRVVEEENMLALDTGKEQKEVLSLITGNKAKLSFDDIKRKHRGKVIYVDFWASWCVPCRVAMPSSVKLKEQLKNIVFVYLSMDSNYDSWKKAALAEGIGNYAESYLITNPSVSDFIQKHKISSIPRYMIFDKQGNLSYERAMDATSKDLPGILHKLSAR